MRKFSILAVTILALSAFVAADAVADDWSGPYVGLQAGAVFGDSTVSADWPGGSDAYDVDLDVNGFTGGILAGYLWGLGNDILIGVEGEASAVSANDDFVESDEGWGAKVTQEWDVALRLLVGKAMGDYMPYITGGVAWAKFNSSGFSTWEAGDDEDVTLTGWTIGAGVEKKINNNLHARIQYRYSDYGDDNWDVDQDFYSNDVEVATLESSSHMLNVALSYHF